MASCLMRMMIPAFPGAALRRRNPWKRGDDEDADYDDGRYDIDDTDDTNGGRGIYAGKNGGVGGISGETVEYLVAQARPAAET